MKNPHLRWMGRPLRLSPRVLTGLILAVASTIFAAPARKAAPSDAGAGVGALPTGTIVGTVVNRATGAHLSSARIVVTGTGREALTDPDGRFRLSGVPAGRASLVASYLGLESRSLTVDVSPGSAASVEIELARSANTTATGDAVVAMDRVTVVADQEMSAQALAMNEQRYAPNIRNVVAFDEFGDRSTENFGDFLRFLAGVSVDDSRATGEAENVMLRGFNGDSTNITVDGAEIAGGTADTRTVSLRNVPLTNVSRVEVTKAPTPDMPASGLGGSINLISRSGFDVRRRQLTYQVYTLLNGRTGLTWDAGPPGPIKEVSPRYIEPSFNLSYLHPINRNLAINVGASRTWRHTPNERGKYTNEGAIWDLAAASPYQTVSHWISTAKLDKTAEGKLGIEWRSSTRHALSASIQQRRNDVFTHSNTNFRVAYGAGAAGNGQFTQGAANGVGSVTSGNQGHRLTDTTSSIFNLKYRFSGENWRFDAAGTWSGARVRGRDISKGNFSAAPFSLANIVIRGDDIPASWKNGVLPQRYTATARTGAAVDLHDIGNYSLASGSSAEYQAKTWRQTVRGDASRTFDGPLALVLKAGLAIDESERNQRRYPQTWNFRPNGAADVNARLARNFDFFDDRFNATAPTIYGRPTRWASTGKVYELYRQRPDWFVLNETAAHQGYVNASRRLMETVKAAYVRTDARLFENRLWVATGVRFERTETRGWGPLDDISAQYQKDAQGRFLLNATGQRILISTNALDQFRARYQERKAYSSRDYSGLYPSLNTTYNFSENLILRGAYARTLGRPNVNFIIPGVTISDPNLADPRITVINTGLKPWTADSFDLSLESYHFKDGFGSIGVFHKRIADFFGASSVPATPELLEQYGLGGDSSLLNYTINTRFNAGDARVRGLEFNYRQSLTMLPSWARGLQAYVNGTWLQLEGSNASDFTGFNPRSFSGGINFIRERYFIKLTCTHQGLTRREMTAVSATVPPNTFSYMPVTTRIGMSAQYSFSRHLALYATVQDLGGLIGGEQRYAPSTPEYAKHLRHVRIAPMYTLGLKGMF